MFENYQMKITGEGAIQQRIPCLRMKQEERVRNFVWITAFCLQLPLLELVSASDIQGGDQPQEHWPGIRRQLFKHFLKHIMR